METQEIRTCNLVYDKWKNGMPIPNGSGKLSDAVFFDAHGFFSFYLNPIEGRNKKYQHIDIQYYTLDDVNKNPKESFFYIICHASTELSGYLDRVDFPLDEPVISLHQKNKNLSLMFLLEHEGDSSDGILKLYKRLIKNKIDCTRVYVINNNSKIYDIKEKNNLEIQVRKLFFIDYSSTLAIQNIESKLVPDKNGKFFMCRNKSHKPHRLNLLAHLRKENLLTDINWSFIPPHDLDITNYEPFHLTFDDIEKNAKLFQDVYTNIKVDDYEIDKNWYSYDTKEFTHHGDFPFEVQVPENPLSYENSYINIVTESQFYNKNECIHITEKTFKPFYFYQIPLIVASSGHIAEVKRRYDFDFFDDIIDHSYDKEVNDKERFFLILNEIKRLFKMKDEIRVFYKENKKRFEENKQKLLSVALDKNDDFQYFWNLL